MSISGARFSLALSLSLFLSMAASAALAQSPRTWNVANHGVDESTCGAAASPCRTISRALSKARAGDFIVVGPGHYGELDGDGELGGVGEEPGCGATLCVNRAVRLLSLEGAERTVINVQTAVGVRINADGARFGLANHGFTVRGATHSAIVVRGAGVWIIDNLVTRSNFNGSNFPGFSKFGILLQSAGGPGQPAASGCLVIGNRAISNSTGFAVRGDNNYLELNLAENQGVGFHLEGSGHRLHNNTAIQSGVGVRVQGSNHRLTRTALIANGTGLNVLPQVSGLIIRESNIYGSLGGQQNVGLINTSGSVVRATNNFWGSATGPGPDPADEIVTDSASETQVVPFATEPFEIRVAR